MKAARILCALSLMAMVLSALSCAGRSPTTDGSGAPATSPEPTPRGALPIVAEAPSAPVSGDVLQPEDLVYLGAFRLPGGDTPPQTFAYGGNAMTFRPGGDPGGLADGFPGSLFVMGHDRQAWGGLPDGNQVAEIDIPAPVRSRILADLPLAGFIQGFHDVSAGHFANLDEIPRVGMQYLDHPDTGPLIHLAWGQHLQSPDMPSHAWFNPTLNTPNLQGIWFIGDQAPYSVNGYMFDIPAAWASTYAQGRVLATGRMRDGGLGGMGPALFAYRPWLPGGSPPAAGTRLSETTLLLYENAHDSDEFVRAMNSYQHADEWEGGAWITTPAGRSAVLFAGTKSTGAKYWYGYIHPDGPEYPCVDADVTDFVTCRLADGAPCPAQDFAGCCTDGVDCVSYRGWWSTNFDAQFILYESADLARVATGQTAPWEPQPYATIDIDQHLYSRPPEWDRIVLGWGDQRRYRIGDVAYDRDSGLLYVLELYADGAMPVIHVWRVAAVTPGSAAEAVQPAPQATARPALTAEPAMTEAPSPLQPGTATRIVFLHHSCGANLIAQGGVREGLTSLGYEFYDHGYNSDGLVLADGTWTGQNYDIPGDNTDPDGLARLFAQPLHDPPDNAFSYLMQYDVLAFKSCFPTSLIESDEQLAAYQGFYLGMRDRMDRLPGKLFVIVTQPPEIPNDTDRAAAARARALANWLASGEFLSSHANVVTFDFFDLLADSTTDMLRSEYRTSESDAHPNELANRTIGPLFVAFMDQAIRSFTAR